MKTLIKMQKQTKMKKKVANSLLGFRIGLDDSGVISALISLHVASLSLTTL